ncbi:Aldolase-type TIM barrel [Pleurotus pulmonarius]
MDEYGGSVEGRTRFAMEVLEAITKAVGQDRTAIRISPWSKFNDMRMEDPKPTFSCLVTQIRERFPDLSYIHVVEPRVADMDIRKDSDLSEDEEIDFLRKIWSPRPFVVAGGYTRELALKGAEKGDIIASGRLFLSNPDLVQRWRKNLPLNAYDRSTFYAHGDASGKGYIDYPFSSGKI